MTTNPYSPPPDIGAILPKGWSSVVLITALAIGICLGFLAGFVAGHIEGYDLGSDDRVELYPVNHK